MERIVELLKVYVNVVTMEMKISFMKKVTAPFKHPTSKLPHAKTGIHMSAPLEPPSPGKYPKASMVIESSHHPLIPQR